MTGPVSAASLKQFFDPLPDAVDTVVIGGGVIGIFTALYLVEMGQRVLVCEKGRVAGEQSSRNWGWLRQQGRDPAELPIMMQAMGLWRQVDARLKGATGLQTCGVTYLASSEREMTKHEEWLSVAKEHGLDTVRLNPAQVQDLFSGQSNGQWVGAIHTASDARAEPWVAVPAVAELAQEEGALIREDCAVRALQVVNGQVTGVITEGGPVRCEQVVLAGGAWSSLLARAHDVHLPQLSVHATVAQTAPMADFFAGNAADEKLALRRRRDGGYSLSLCDAHGFYPGPDLLRNLWVYRALMVRNFSETGLNLIAPQGFPDAWGTARRWEADAVSPFERMRVLEPVPNGRYVKRMQARFAKRFPEIGPPVIQSAWAGMIDTLPDVVPVVDHAPLAGLIVATGMAGHGFGIGPGFGRVLARMVTGKPAEHDLSRFRFGRFTDGSPLNVASGL